jgi:hypothetical protein
MSGQRRNHLQELTRDKAIALLRGGAIPAIEHVPDPAQVETAGAEVGAPRYPHDPRLLHRQSPIFRAVIAAPAIAPTARIPSSIQTSGARGRPARCGGACDTTPPCRRRSGRR